MITKLIMVGTIAGIGELSSWLPVKIRAGRKVARFGPLAVARFGVAWWDGLQNDPPAVPPG